MAQYSEPTETNFHQAQHHNENKQLPIDIHYDKWSRFENFLKFAEKKEVRDRLKELDPPPLSNYVDVQTIDNIKKARKDPQSLIKKPDNRTQAQKEAQNKKENDARIKKMKEMYNMFIQMEKEENTGKNSAISTNRMAPQL